MRNTVPRYVFDSLVLCLGLDVLCMWPFHMVSFHIQCPVCVAGCNFVLNCKSFTLLKTPISLKIYRSNIVSFTFAGDRVQWRRNKSAKMRWKRTNITIGSTLPSPNWTSQIEHAKTASVTSHPEPRPPSDRRPPTASTKVDGSPPRRRCTRNSISTFETDSMLISHWRSLCVQPHVNWTDGYYGYEKKKQTLRMQTWQAMKWIYEYVCTDWLHASLNNIVIIYNMCSCYI